MDGEGCRQRDSACTEAVAHKCILAKCVVQLNGNSLYTRFSYTDEGQPRETAVHRSLRAIDHGGFGTRVRILASPTQLAWVLLYRGTYSATNWTRERTLFPPSPNSRTQGSRSEIALQQIQARILKALLICGPGCHGLQGKVAFKGD